MLFPSFLRLLRRPPEPTPTHGNAVLRAIVTPQWVRLVVVRRHGAELVHHASDPTFTLHATGDGGWAGDGWSAFWVCGVVTVTLDLFAIPDGATRGHRLHYLGEAHRLGHRTESAPTIAWK